MCFGGANKWQKSTECGRSMVEMLGVLAVVGIIGLTGVKMFNSAMNSHRANELIYEANKRATMVATQVMAGNTTLSIGEFMNPEGHTFGVEVNPKNVNQFNITITGVDSEVCQKMKNAVGDGTSIRVISEFCDKLTFNNDLSATVYASDIQTATECTNAGNTWCGGTGECQEESNCCAGKTVGPCQTCSEGAILASLVEGTSCDYDGNGTVGDGVCHLGQCQALPANVTCNVNTGLCTCTNGGQLCNRATGLCCTSDEICLTNGDVNNADDETKDAKCVAISGCATNAGCSGNTPWCYIYAKNCYSPTQGKCISKAQSAAISVNIKGLGEVIISTNSMNWWSARNWCEAHGKHLLNIEDFQVYQPKGTVLLTTGAGTGSWPCHQGQTCNRWDSGYEANVMWQSNSGAGAHTLTNATDVNGVPYSTKYSPAVLDLARHFKGEKDYIWTASDYKKTDACQAFMVNLKVGMIDSNIRYGGNLFALCK